MHRSSSYFLVFHATSAQLLYLLYLLDIAFLVFRHIFLAFYITARWVVLRIGPWEAPTLEHTVAPARGRSHPIFGGCCNLDSRRAKDCSIGKIV